MVDSVYIVRSTPLRAFTGSFQHFEDMLQTYWKSLIFFDKLTGFNLAIFSTLWRYVADLLKMCMKKFNAEKNIFWQTVCRGYHVSRTYCQVSLILCMVFCGIVFDSVYVIVWYFVVLYLTLCMVFCLWQFRILLGFYYKSSLNKNIKNNSLKHDTLVVSWKWLLACLCFKRVFFFFFFFQHF